MPANDTLYVFCPDDEGEDADDDWLQPRPIEAALAERVAATTETEADEIGELEEYVDREEVQRLLKGDPDDDTLTFDVEGHDVTLRDDGTLEVED
jgi:hypothetical protein